MRKEWGRMLVMGLTWAVLFGLPGIENASGQFVFQTYLKPQVAPPFSLEDLHGKRVDIRDHRDQAVLLNFWATW